MMGPPFWRYRGLDVLELEVLEDTLAFLGIPVGPLGGALLGLAMGSRRDRRSNLS